MKCVQSTLSMFTTRWLPIVIVKMYGGYQVTWLPDITGRNLRNPPSVCLLPDAYGYQLVTNCDRENV